MCVGQGKEGKKERWVLQTFSIMNTSPCLPLFFLPCPKVKEGESVSRNQFFSTHRVTRHKCNCLPSCALPYLIRHAHTSPVFYRLLNKERPPQMLKKKEEKKKKKKKGAAATHQ